MVQFLPQARLQAAPGIGGQLAALGETVANTVKERRGRSALAEFAKTQDPSALIASGDSRLAQLGAQIQLRRDELAAKPAPLTFEQRLKLKQAGRPVTNVNVTNKGEQKGAEALGKLTAEQFVEAQKQGALARQGQSDRAILRDALSNPDVFTGTGGEAINAVKKAGSTLFNLNFEGVADAEVVSTIGKKAALNLKSDLPGPLSDSDRRFLVSIPPGLNKSPEANRRLILLSDVQDELKIEKAEIFRKNLRENGSVDPAAFNEVALAEARASRKMQGHIAELRARAKQAKTRSPFAGIPIERMSRTQLKKLNPKNLTENQLQQVIERERQLDGQ